MDPVHVPSVAAASFPLPPRLEGLRRMAYNLHWAWHPRTRGLWSLVDRHAWNRYRNPVPVISGPTEWSRLLDDAAFLTEYNDVLADFDHYMANGSGHWFQQRYADDLAGPIAYFCAEYGLHESLGIYSGGLGVLAGDHMKTASDMALPALGVGLLYRNGYFRQAIDADGHQEHDYPDYDLSRLPISRVQDAERPAADRVGRAARPGPGGRRLARPGRPHPGPAARHGRRRRTRLPDRPITHILYVRGREMRLHQELVLGVGGVRAIRALGLSPAVWHLNEGHSAFLLAERAGEYLAAGETQEQAWAKVRRDSVFTIHTPVSAGNERFDADLVRRVAGPVLGSVRPAGRRRPGQGHRHGRRPAAVRHDGVLAPPDERRQRREPAPRRDRPDHLARHHGPRDPWASPTASTARRGSARRSWTCSRASSMRTSTTSIASTQQGRFWERLERIPAKDLWDAHRRQKRELAEFARRRLRNQFARHGEAPAVLAELETALDPDILTIGFARRFATYKRAGLLFSDIDRLARILWDADRPVQIVFAGKAHPADRPGQRVIQEIFQLSRSPALRGRVFIMENYDMRVGRFLVQGVDAWLNNPRRPLEASGTSGMKAAQNGVPNISVLDGWWDEGYAGDNGWAIGGREMRPGRGGPGLGRRAGPLSDSSRTTSSRATTSAARTACRCAGWTSCAEPWRRPSGSSRRPGCSTSTSSGCTCRRPASPSPNRPTAPAVTEAG